MVDFTDLIPGAKPTPPPAPAPVQPPPAQPVQPLMPRVTPPPATAQPPPSAAGSQMASPGPQTWTDWATKTYNPSWRDYAAGLGNAASYGMAPLASQGLQSAGVDVGKYTPEYLRRRAQEASNAMGPMTPAVDVLGYGLSPLTWAGVGPASRAIGKIATADLPAASEVAAKYLPEGVAKYVPSSLFPRAVEGAVQGGVTSGASAAGQGGDYQDIIDQTLKGMGLGTAIAGATSLGPLGGATAEDVGARTAAAAQAGREELGNLKYPPPTGADKPRFGVSIPSATETGGPPGVFVPGPNAVTSAADIAANLRATRGGGGDPLASAVVAERLQRNLQERAPIGGTPGQGAAAVAAQQPLESAAAYAQTLDRWSKSFGMPGADVQGEAAKMAQNYDISSPQFSALRAIATAKPSDRPMVDSALRYLFTTAGSGAGELASAVSGVSHLAPVGSLGGGMVYDALRGRIMGSGSTQDAARAAIERAYPAMTGQAVGPGGGQALGNALIRAMLGS